MHSPFLLLLTLYSIHPCGEASCYFRTALVFAFMALSVLVAIERIAF